MSPVIWVAVDLLGEAVHRRWFLALAIVITLLLVTLGLSLRMDVVDGALAGTRLFGELLRTDIRSADVALRPVFEAVAYLVFYGGSLFMIVASADFGPSLFAPGRIEHLLSLPVRRWQLLAGTYLGVMTLAGLGAAYGAGGVTVIMGFKTGVWTLRPLAAALLGCAGFSAICALMLTAAVFVRSAAMSAALGLALLVLGIVAGYRTQLAPMFEAGPWRSLFLASSLTLPRLSSLANAAGDLAGAKLENPLGLVGVLSGTLVFAAGVLAVGAWRFEQRDF